MHLVTVLNARRVRQRHRESEARNADSGSGTGPLHVWQSRQSHGLRGESCLGLSWGLLSGKTHTWLLISLAVWGAVLCVGMFEATRLTIRVLKSPCTVLGVEVLDTGSCLLCDLGPHAPCEEHPVAAARLAVTYRPLHLEENITGWVWHCRGAQEGSGSAVDPCQVQPRFLNLEGASSPIACSAGEVLAFVQEHAVVGSQRSCFYSSLDEAGEDVWLSMPSPGLADHAWFQKHLEYFVMLALGGFVLLVVLLGCLSLEGAELWASGLLS